MIIDRLLLNCPMSPTEMNRIVAAYERALQTLCVKDRDDPLTEMIAKKVIEIARTGVDDPTQISAQAIHELEIR